MNNYALNTPGSSSKKVSTLGAMRAFMPYLKGEFGKISFAVLAIFINGSINLVGPALVAYAIDTYVLAGDYAGVMSIAAVLTVLFAVSMVAAYLQTRVMGAVAQRLLFTLRNTIFQKLQALPVSFFQQNKTGDLIARINSDTDKLNQFFSQSLMQFIGSLFMMTGAVVFLLVINVRLGAATLAPALCLLIITQALSAWIRTKNAASLQASGGMSAEIQESLQNFNVIVAFNRRDYFRESFQEANRKNFRTAVSAGLANTIFIPLYGFSSAVAQLIVLTYGIYSTSYSQRLS
jgi:ATP-binding cassette subfamily B protein